MGLLPERSRHSHQGVPVFAEQMGICYAVKQRIEASVISLAVHLIEVLIGQIAQPGHKGIAQQITQSKDVFREAVRIRVRYNSSRSSGWLSSRARPGCHERVRQYRLQLILVWS